VDDDKKSCIFCNGRGKRVREVSCNDGTRIVDTCGVCRGKGWVWKAPWDYQEEYLKEYEKKYGKRP
jgi:DnaJ-class molecular chaperone